MAETEARAQKDQSTVMWLEEDWHSHTVGRI